MKNLTEVNQNVQKEFNKKQMLIAKISLILGIFGLVLTIILGVFFEDKNWVDYLIWFFSFVFAYGLVIMILIKRINKKAVVKIQTNEYEFFEEYFTILTYYKEELVGTSKVYYKDILKTKITKNYLFIYISISQALPVDRSKMSVEDFIQLNTWLKIAKKKQP